MVIYFSGTGNSEYIAKLFAQNLNDEILCATQYIKKGEYPKFVSQTPYVFVCPTYAWRIPIAFDQWIKKCNFEGNKKAYFVLTCGGDIGGASKYAKQTCDEVGFEYMGMQEIVMPENYIALFSAPDENDIKEIVDEATQKTLQLIDFVKEEKIFEKVKISPAGAFSSGIVNRLFVKCVVKDKKFYTNGNCIACAKCVEGCMMNNIVLKDGRPQWQGNCIHCMACINKCPTEAIEYGRHTANLSRYVFKNEKI